MATPLDACSFLTTEEVAAVQGEPIKETKPMQRSDRGLAMSDCFIALPTFSNSISLSVVQPTGSDASGVEQFWKENLLDAVARGSEKSPPPTAIEGIGDQAFWLGDARMGALYVRTGDRYIRISVGGAGDQQAKIEKCKALAAFVLKRL